MESPVAQEFPMVRFFREQALLRGATPAQKAAFQAWTGQPFPARRS